MSLMLLGDIHGVFDELAGAVQRAPSEVTAILQVGDFGWYARRIHYFDSYTPRIPVFFIDGNHEQHALLESYTEITELADNISFVPRGTVLTIDGVRIACMGGAASVDKAIQMQYRQWSNLENITPEQVDRFANVKEGDVDLFVTHVPPQSVIQQHFDPYNLSYFGLPPTWRDPNADIVEKLWNQFGRPYMAFGHMHRSIDGPGYRLLDINEALVI